MIRNYPRPELEEGELIQARMDAAKLIRKYGMNKALEIITLLAIENVRLTKEINQHRAVRDIEPLETYKV